MSFLGAALAVLVALVLEFAFGKIGQHAFAWTLAGCVAALVAVALVEGGPRWRR